MRAMLNSENIETTLARLPDFTAIKPADIVAQFKRLLAEQRSKIRGLARHPEQCTFESLVPALEALADELHRFYSPISHLHNVADTAELREPYKECVALIAEFASELDQDAALFACYTHIAAQDDFPLRDEVERRVVNNALRDFRLGGIALATDQQAEVKQLRSELAKLTTAFEENLLDATQAFRLHITDLERLAGLPASVITMARENAHSDGQTGWTLTLDLPCYVPAMMHLQDRERRQALYRAYATRASDQAPADAAGDNSQVMNDIVGRRQTLAKALGFGNFAELSLATKMAPSTSAVVDFLHQLADRAKPSAARELDELKAWARTHLALEDIEAWDLAYCSERYREQRFEFSQEDLRPYFAAGRVVDGLFDVVAKLFNVHIKKLTQPISSWHEDVEFFALSDGAGDTIGYFFLDIYARAGKRSGAWMDECLVRWRSDAGTQLPVAYLNCNFTPPQNDEPALLTHNEVITLFHEFGHGLHHMLTRIDYRSVAGINGVPWDAVELPSQILENWCWQREALDLIAAHYEDGSPLPAQLYERLQAAKHYQAALQTLRQVEFALFDFRLHMEYRPGFNIQQLLDNVRERVAVATPPAWNRFQHSFAHIFAGGYAAGYYSYKWAEVLAADAFARFEDEGLFNSATGSAFRQAVLEQGGAEDAMTLFKRFRGREPEVEPLLRQAGLIA